MITTLKWMDRAGELYILITKIVCVYLGYFYRSFVFFRMSVSEFKPPMMNTDPQPPPTKKKRRTSNAITAAAQPPQSPAMQDLLPPPLTGNLKKPGFFFEIVFRDIDLIRPSYKY